MTTQHDNPERLPRLAEHARHKIKTHGKHLPKSCPPILPDKPERQS